MPSVLSKLTSSSIGKITTLTKDGHTGTILLSTTAIAFMLYKLRKRQKSVRRKKKWTNRHHNDDRVNKEVPEATSSDTNSEDDVVQIPGINVPFIQQFLRLMKIVMPTVMGREMATLSALTFFLFARTFLSIYVAHLEGDIVKYVVRRDAYQFLRMLIKWFSIAIPATFINSMLRIRKVISSSTFHRPCITPDFFKKIYRYLEGKLSLMFRSRLVEHSYRMYFKNESYYKITVLDSRIEDDCAQRLTDDLEIVSSTICRLYSQITKPLFDLLLIVISLAQMTRNTNSRTLLVGPVICGGIVLSTGLFLRVVSPRFGQLVSTEADKRGHLRFCHSRLITNAEEIAFYRGHRVECNQLKTSYRSLVEHIEKVLKIKLWFIMLEQFLMKYIWGGAGMIMISIPILFSKSRSAKDGGIGQRTQYFTTAKNLLISGSDAIERLMTSYKDVVELSGYVSRVDNMLNVFNEVSRCKYEKLTMLKKRSPILQYNIKGQPKVNGIMEYNNKKQIVVDKVAIVTPNGDIVCPELNLNLINGLNLLITGPNGCGKSSLFRILAGLWPIYRGNVSVPKGGLFYIPQRPYMTLGTLKDQIIYPDSNVDMINRQMTEADLRDILRLVNLEHIVDRDGFDTVQDWNDTLSGGEKQRMAVARMFYHKPDFALLDECTSAVSIDVEGKIYQSAIDMGITLLTITHRPTLWRFHSHILQFDGTGSWYFSELNASERINLREKKESLLKEKPSKERDRQLNEICKRLAEDL